MPFSTTRKSVISDVEYVFTFGKHKGEKLEDIISDDPSYVVWLDDEGILKFSDKIYQEAQSYDYDDGDSYENWMEEPF